MSAEQLRALEERFRFDFYVYDEPLAPVFTHATLSKKSLPLSHPTANSINRLALQSEPTKMRLKKVNWGFDVCDF